MAPTTLAPLMRYQLRLFKHIQDALPAHCSSSTSYQEDLCRPEIPLPLGVRPLWQCEHQQTVKPSFKNSRNELLSGLWAIKGSPTHRVWILWAELWWKCLLCHNYRETEACKWESSGFTSVLDIGVLDCLHPIRLRLQFSSRKSRKETTEDSILYYHLFIPLKLKMNIRFKDPFLISTYKQKKLNLNQLKTVTESNNSYIWQPLTSLNVTLSSHLFSEALLPVPLSQVSICLSVKPWMLWGHFLFWLQPLS